MNIIITGSTGMVGRSVLNECLKSDQVNKIVIVNRRSLQLANSKLKEIILADFKNFDSIKSEFASYDACFHCMGVSSVGMDEEKYTELTFDITKSLADACYEANPKMVFNYVSGVGTDSTEKGSSMWGRVKGKTENYILSKGFKDAYMIRLGALIPEDGITSSTKLYNALYVVMRPFFPLMKRMKSITTSSKLGRAMINTVLLPQKLKYLTNQDLNALSTK